MVERRNHELWPERCGGSKVGLGLGRSCEVDSTGSGMLSGNDVDEIPLASVEASKAFRRRIPGGTSSGSAMQRGW